MQQLLFERLAEEENVEMHSPVALLNVVRISNRENLNLALLERSVSYEDRGHSDHIGKSARLWLSQIKHIHLILMLHYSVKTNNFSLFYKCNRDMADLFVA